MDIDLILTPLVLDGGWPVTVWTSDVDNEVRELSGTLVTGGPGGVDEAVLRDIANVKGSLVLDRPGGVAVTIDGVVAGVVNGAGGAKVAEDVEVRACTFGPTVFGL